uniref:ST3 beta-galactoside alpha-2,3-sialyltransferase 8 n=1 Tax=Neogobius melanostomus TaxID=47308 RepID=A0A8C6WKI8_9GOBI
MFAGQLNIFLRFVKILQRFDPEQQPILRQNQSLEDGALSWWLVSDSKLIDIRAIHCDCPSPPHRSPTPRNLRESGHGKLIDSHHNVIRMNHAVMAGFERDVGNRSTHHILYPESAMDLRRGNTSALTTGDVTRVSADRDRVLVVSPEFFSYIHHNWTEKHGRYPSTGLTAVIYALHTCDQVSLFGFGADSEGNWHHYWEKNKFAGAFRKTGVHNADYETEILQQLHREGKVQLYM